jgi:hypothetical protein
LIQIKDSLPRLIENPGHNPLEGVDFPLYLALPQHLRQGQFFEAQTASGPDFDPYQCRTARLAALSSPVSKGDRIMASEESRPAEFLKMFQDIFLRQQTLLPSGRIAQRLTDATRRMMDAHLAYQQAMMRANTSMLEAWFDKPEAAESERPSEAAKKPGLMAA